MYVSPHQTISPFRWGLLLNIWNLLFCRCCCCGGGDARPDPPFANDGQNCLLFDQPDFGTYVDDYPLYEGPVGREGDWWYCADFCAPGRCEEGQVCELLPTPCPAFWVPCPLVAACYDQCSEGCEANEVREDPV